MIMSGDRFKFIIINTNPTHTIMSSQTPTNMIDTSPLIATELDHYLQAPPGKFAQFFPESALFTLIKYANTILYIINFEMGFRSPTKKKIYILLLAACINRHRIAFLLILLMRRRRSALELHVGQPRCRGECRVYIPDILSKGNRAHGEHSASQGEKNQTQ